MSTPDAATSTTTTDDPALEDRVEKLERVYENELQKERERRQELEEELEVYRDLFDFREKTEDGLKEVDPQEAGLTEVWIGGAPAGQIINKAQGDIGLIETLLHELTGINPEDLTTEEESVEDGNQLRRLKAHVEENDIQFGESESQHGASVRDDIHDAHCWMMDLNRNGGADRTKEQNRVAHLFRRFVRKAAGENETGVDASGQTYSVTTKAATEILVGEHALEGVTKKSRSTTVARVMRAAQRATSYDVDCQCEDVDECPHALLEFRPGKPHTLAVRKQDLEEYLEDYSDRVEGGEADDGGNSPEDSDRDAAMKELEESRDRLNAAEVGRE